MKFSGPIGKVLTGLGFFFLISLVSIAGYMWSGATLVDSIYMVIITIFAVGYEEVVVVDTVALRLLTICLIVVGYIAVVYTIGGFMQLLIDGELNRVMGARKMTREIAQLENHTIICGLGRMGTMLARELEAAKRPFVIVDRDEARLQSAESPDYLVLQGDATEEQVLEKAGIERAAALATVLAQDALNVFVTITARAMNPELMIISRGECPSTERKLLGCGANRVILPAAIGATKVAHLIVRPSAENLLDELNEKSHLHEELEQIGLHFDELEVAEGSSLIGQDLGHIEVRSNHGFLVVAVRHKDGATVVNPPSSTELVAGDIVIVLGHDDDIPELAERFSQSSSPSQMKYRGATLDS